MRHRFELHKRDGEAMVLLFAFEEDCPGEDLDRRAKLALGTQHLDERQDLVLVRDATGAEVFRWVIGTSHRITMR